MGSGSAGNFLSTGIKVDLHSGAITHGGSGPPCSQIAKPHQPAPSWLTSLLEGSQSILIFSVVALMVPPHTLISPPPQTHTDTQRDTQTHTRTYRHTQRDTHSETHRDTHTDTQTHSHTHRQTETHTQTYRHTQRETHTHRHRDTHRHTQRHTHTDRRTEGAQIQEVRSRRRVAWEQGPCPRQALLQLRRLWTDIRLYLWCLEATPPALGQREGQASGRWGGTPGGCLTALPPGQRAHPRVSSWRFALLPALRMG